MQGNLIDKDQSIRIQALENRVNLVENELSAIVAQLKQATGLLKLIGLGLGAVLGIDLQGMII
tara:strand:- start:394 stop:582 length:189 start_codon:yes stop_codon:yes gene_type:complete